MIPGKAQGEEPLLSGEEVGIVFEADEGQMPALARGGEAHFWEEETGEELL